MKILVVDDEPDILEAIELSWLDEDVELLLANSGRAALALLDGAPDVVLTDYRMPGMSGLELIAAIHERSPGLPAVLMSAFPDEDLQRRGAEQGIADFVAKPFLAADLLARVRAAAVA